MERRAPGTVTPSSPEAFFNRELSWLAFARRVLALVEDDALPLLERVKFAGIMGMLHDEFFMKRMSGLKRQMEKASRRRSLDGRLPQEEYAACREELVAQSRILDRLALEELGPALARESVPIHGWHDLDDSAREHLRRYYVESVHPILTPLAVDAEHPFPFISNLGLNLAVLLPDPETGRTRFVRVKVPGNRPRWIPVPGGGFVPLEQVIAANLDLTFPASPPPAGVYPFRVTRGAESDRNGRHEPSDDDEAREPGRIVRLVSDELKARRFAGVVRLQVDARMPDALAGWLAAQLRITPHDVYRQTHFLGLSDLLRLEGPERPELRLPRHEPATHPRLRDLPPEPWAIFEEIRRGDILLHHPYDGFDSSVLRFLESAAADPNVLAIKLTIYRTSSDSPIVRALADAARRGKQVAVLVEITARFDEAPNIAWGQYLENEGVHVAYGVERLKTHVKLALVVREEAGVLRRYAHVGTGNYHTGTARLYEDLGILTCDSEVCDDVALVFNELTAAMPPAAFRRLLVAPTSMRDRFIGLIARETDHARAGRPSGIVAKMNQLQDREVIGALYEAAGAGVPIELNVRGLCCLRPGVPGLSESIRVYGVVGRFLEHSRIYRFENGGDPEYFTGSADWMKRNLENRVETIVPVRDEAVKRELETILRVYREDNASAWDCAPDGTYVRRTPAPGEPRRAAQDEFIRLAREGRLGGAIAQDSVENAIARGLTSLSKSR